MKEKPSSSQDQSCGSVSLLTRQYRESVLQLGTTCDERTSWQTSQFILDKLWKDNEKDDKNQTITYGCQSCGSLIHPGYIGTGLRVTRGKKHSRSRTVRRREQRKRRKEALQEEKEAKSSNRRIDSQDDQPRTKMLLLEDDRRSVLDRHHLLIKCGRCRLAVCCKGIRREALKAKTPSPSIHTNEWKPENDVESDFVKLPSISTPAPTLLEQNEGKKRKKKKKAPPKSNLMSFLNSLND
eukprot:scaffold5281_cov127-Cylindrotheca_fusiformis.AAC.11